MPTPFYHLSVAQSISEHPILDPKLRSFLSEYMGAFLLGNTAPDVQVISGQDRSATHFFSVPIPPGGQAPWKRLVDEYPQVIQPEKIKPDEAAFIAGYLCHLQADWIWIREIFEPVFGPQHVWGTFSERLYLHNILRSYLDEKVIATLSTSIVSTLRKTTPQRWLSFIQDKFLMKWRDYLCDQLQSGKQVRTIEVFASRHGIDPAAFQEMISSEERMDAEVFARISRQEVDDYREGVISQNLELLEDYLNKTNYSRIRLSSSMHNNDWSVK